MDMNEEQIAEFLHCQMEMWSFSRLLQENYRGSEPLQVCLTRKLWEYERVCESDSDSIARKVRNWLKDVNRPGSREELFRICFALELDEERADAVLCSTAESGIHYRNPKELVYAFCLRKGYDYPGAQELLRCMGQGDSPQKDQDQRETLRRTSGLEPKQYTTISVRDEFKSVTDKEGLALFLESHGNSLGFHHNTAYSKFLLMLNHLADGGEEDYPGLPAERRYHIREVAEEYLRMGVPYDRKNRNYTKLQKEIKRYWPSPKSIQEMVSRKLDVNRKTLLILYFATEGMDADVPEESYTEEHCRRINLMLSQCGMALLDPHNPFDFLILQSLRLEREEESMSWRMERFLWKVFRNEKAAYITAAEKGGGQYG